MVRESIQSQRSHYCMTSIYKIFWNPAVRFGVRQSLTQFWGVVRWLCIFTKVVPEIYACMKTYRPVYHHHYQILFIICKFRRYSSWIVLISRSTLVNKAGTWVDFTLWFVLWLQKIPKCHLLATTGAVSCLAISIDRISTGGNAECHRQRRGGDGSASDEEGILSLLQGFVTQLDEWKRQIPNNWRAFNCLYIWKTSYPHAHILQIRKLRLKEESWFGRPWKLEHKHWPRSMCFLSQ